MRAIEFPQVSRCQCWFRFTAILAALLAAGGALAQNANQGDVRGTVTDTNGAVVPGVKVTVLDVDKGVTSTFTTDDAGLYDTGSIVTDHYLFTFTKDGFETYQQGPITVDVGVINLDAKLQIGSVVQRIVVTTDAPMLKTESSEQSVTLNAEYLNDLPQIGADWQNLMTLMQGVSSYNSRGASGTNSVNGGMPYVQIGVDGVNATNFQNLNTTDIPMEAIQELQIQTNTFSAQYGSGGAVFNQITKGGSDRFHGSLYDYLQNNALNAASYGFGSKVGISKIRYNNFGGSVGGPVWKKKVFFYFLLDDMRNPSASFPETTVPTQAFLNGDFSALTTSSGAQKLIYDPTTQTVDASGVVHRQSFAAEYGNGNKIPTSLLDPVALALEKYYPLPNNPANETVTNGIPSNNWESTTLLHSSSPWNRELGRLDWNVTGTNHIILSDFEEDQPVFQQYIGDCPLECDYQDVESNTATASDVWQITPSLSNEARMGFTYLPTWYDPYGGLNSGDATKVGWLFGKANILPNVGGPGGFFSINPGGWEYQLIMLYDPSDMVTWIKGAHVMHFGGEVTMGLTNGPNWNALNAGTMSFSGNYTTDTNGDSANTGYAYADFLLGYFSSWSAYNRPISGNRIKMPQLFVQDDWKVRRNLTLNLGLRWEGTTGYVDIHNNALSFDPTIINPANKSLGAMWYAGQNGRNRVIAPVWSTFLPRVGVNWQESRSRVVRGGFGMFGLPFSISMNATSNLEAAFGQSGNLSDATNGTDSVGKLSGTGNEVYQPSGQSINSVYLNAPTTPQAYNGQSVPYAQYHQPVSKEYEWNAEVEQSLGNDMVVTLGYVGSHTADLQYQVDINQVPESELSVNDTSERPYPLFQSITGGGYPNAVANFNSLQTAVRRRIVSGLQFNVNYVWAHMLSDMDSAGWGTGKGGTDDWQNAYDTYSNYGSSNFDIRHSLKAYATYDLPFGRQRRWLNNNYFLDEAVGGWQLAPTWLWHSGNPFTTIMSYNDSYSQGSGASWYPNQVGNPKPAQRTLKAWYNEDAFAAPTVGTYGDVRRNNLTGPRYVLANLSMAKTFHIWESVNMQFRAEAQNFLNHPSFSNPNAAIGPGQIPQITGTTVGGRQVQLYARFSF